MCVTTISASLEASAGRQVRAIALDTQVEQRFLEALGPDQLTLALAALAHLEQAEQATILALGSDLPAIWHAPTTTSADRKQMLRLLIRDVIVDGKRAHGQVWVQINWQTGAHEQFCYTRSVRSDVASADVEALEQRIRELNVAGLIDAQIAEILNAEGYRTARLHRPFTGGTVWLLREKWDIPTVKINGKEYNPAQWEDGSYSVQGAAARLGVHSGTIHHWLKVGKLIGSQLAKGMPWKIYLTEEDVTRLQEWLRRARRLRREAL